MSKPLAARLAPLTVLDERGTATVLGSIWAHRPAVVAFVRHFGWIFCRQQVAGLKAAQPAIAERGAALVVVGPARPEHIAGFREATGYDGMLFVDPSLGSFREAGLAHGWAETFHPLAVVKGVRAFANGFRQGVRQGDPVQQGGTFVLGPGEAVRFEWRDRHAGDHPDLRDVLAALGPGPGPEGGTRG